MFPLQKSRPRDATRWEVPGPKLWGGSLAQHPPHRSWVSWPCPPHWKWFQHTPSKPEEEALEYSSISVLRGRWCCHIDHAGQEQERRQSLNPACWQTASTQRLQKSNPDLACQTHYKTSYQRDCWKDGALCSFEFPVGSQTPERNLYYDHSFSWVELKLLQEDTASFTDSFTKSLWRLSVPGNGIMGE